jgi:hypothetical protein
MRLPPEGLPKDFSPAFGGVTGAMQIEPLADLERLGVDLASDSRLTGNRISANPIANNRIFWPPFTQ